MISRLHGEVVEKDDRYATIDVGGVGYEVALTETDLSSAKLGEPVTLYTYFHVREGAQELFGFTSADTRQLFKILISVSGVGPKMAMSILDLGEPSQIRRAIASGNTNYISGAAGVGKRLAERVAVDLKDKVGIVGGTGFDPSQPETGDDAMDALVALGYSRSQAMTALVKVDQDASTEQRVKQALKDIK